MRFNKHYKLIGYFLTLTSLLFLLQAGTRLEIDWGLVILPSNLLVLILASFVYFWALFFRSFAWKFFLEFYEGKKIKTRNLVAVYAKASIAKYLPGNIFHFVGRNVLGQKFGWGNKAMVKATIADTVVMLVSSLFLAFMLGYQAIFSVAKALLDFLAITPIGWFIIILISLVILIAAFLNTKNFTNKNKYLFELGLSKNLLKTFTINIGAFTLGGLILLGIFYFILELDLNLQLTIQIIASYVIAWSCGFVVPGSPGGLGVREFVLFTLLAPLFTSADVLLAATLQRLSSLLGDLLFFLYGDYIYRSTRQV